MTWMLETLNKENYRPVSLLPVVSKIFMLKQIKPFIETFLSKWLCGYRKGYNSQYALIAMVERLKKQIVCLSMYLSHTVKYFSAEGHSAGQTRCYKYCFMKQK